MTRRTLLTLALGTVASRGWAVGDGRLGQPALPAAAGGPANDEDRWAKEIAAFAAEDEARPFAPGGIVFVGSSSIRLWDLAAVVPGPAACSIAALAARRSPTRSGTSSGSCFGTGRRRSSSMPATTTCRPDGRPQQVLADFEAFVGRVHAALPATRIAFIGIKPSLARWAIVDKVREANRLVRARCDRDDRLGFVDVDGPMIGWDGKPRADLFVKDGLHLSPKGYALVERPRRAIPRLGTPRRGGRPGRPSPGASESGPTVRIPSPDPESRIPNPDSRMTDQKPYGVAILGLGHWYSAYGLARALPEYPHARLVVVASPDEAHRTTFCDTFGVEGVASYAEAIARPDVDIVHIATPVCDIPALTIAAARAGKHIVMGKPMAMTMAQADAMVDGGRGGRRGVRAVPGPDAAAQPRAQGAHRRRRDRRRRRAAPGRDAGRSPRTGTTRARPAGSSIRRRCPAAPSSTRASTGSTRCAGSPAARWCRSRRRCATSSTPNSRWRTGATPC